MKKRILSRMNRVWLWVLLAGLSSAVVAVEPASANPPTPVTCGDTISAPGDYSLRGDCSGDGITIAANGVHLQLNGFTMHGGEVGIGIGFLGVPRFALHIEGPGTITGYDKGIDFKSAFDALIERVTTTANVEVGVSIDLSQRDHFMNVVSTGNGSGFSQSSSSSIDYDHVIASSNQIGIFFAGVPVGSTATKIHGSTANGNSVGIEIMSGSTGNDVDGNTALRNIQIDLQDDNPGCDSNKWHGNQFDPGSANQPCIH
jgi:hypothetical protein